MPKALDSNGPSVQLAPIRVPATLAARLEAFVLRPALFRPSLAAVTRAALEAGIAVLESGAPTSARHAPAPAQHTPRKRKPSDEKRAAERAAARAAREAKSTTEAAES